MTDSEGRESVKEMSRPKVKISNFNCGYGLSVIGRVEQKAVNFLIDTGSAVTLLSYRIFHHLDIDQSGLKEVPFDICLADGTDLGVRGQVQLDITLGPLKVEHTIIIANITQEAILGMDFMTEQECQLDLHNSMLRVQGIEVNMRNDNHTVKQCCQLRLTNDVIIPARHEKLLTCSVRKRGNEANINIVEGSMLTQAKTGLLIARSLVDISKGKTFVRVCNPSEDDIKVHQGTTMAIGEPVEVCSLSKSCMNIRVDSNESPLADGHEKHFPEHLQDVLDRASPHLSRGKRNSQSKIATVCRHYLRQR